MCLWLPSSLTEQTSDTFPVYDKPKLLMNIVSFKILCTRHSVHTLVFAFRVSPLPFAVSPCLQSPH